MSYLSTSLSRDYYEDFYDKSTVRQCQNLESLFLAKYPEYTKVRFPLDERFKTGLTAAQITNRREKEDAWIKSLTQAEKETECEHIIILLSLWNITHNRAANRTAAIDKWIQNDVEKDQKREKLWNEYHADEKKRCRMCGDLMKCFQKAFYEIAEPEDRILFMYKCIDCDYREAEFENGEIWKPKKAECPKCFTPLKEREERLKNKFRHYQSCPQCDFKNTWDLDLTPTQKLAKKETLEEKQMEKDKLRFWVSEKEAEEFVREQEGCARLIESWEKDKAAELFGESRKQIEQLENIPILEAQKRIKAKLKNKNFLKMKFEEPEIGRDLICNFRVYENDLTRSPKDAEKELASRIKLAIQDTNWKLVSDGISHRMGIFSGRIRGLEISHYL